MVKLTIKTLAAGSFTVEAADTDTVLEVKNKINAAKSYAVESQKLIYSGAFRLSALLCGHVQVCLAEVTQQAKCWTMRKRFRA